MCLPEVSHEWRKLSLLTTEYSQKSITQIKVLVLVILTTFVAQLVQAAAGADAAAEDEEYKGDDAHANNENE